MAVFVPFATAATLLSWYSVASISPRALWGWVQAAGQRAMEQLHEQLQAVAQGQMPTEEPLATELGAAPLLLGADGVMVPFRPEGGQPRGKIRWREIKVGVLARLGQHRTRTGKVVARLHQRRLVAVLGDIEALKPRLWLEAVRQGIRTAPQVVWLSDGARGLWRLYDERLAAYATGASWTFTTPCSTSGRGRQPGWMGAPPRRAGGLAGHGTACGMASRTGSWQTWSRPWI
ncbi:MAG: hypothetical protein AUG75_04345 [Cyanobacteria bacterium 13_1_20CM_4_61_6]|nr:MAG: hypothetical protein AUG75_04345 [Cyanobacteria bacterium 13_1_20CM_4_61_6]